MKNFKQTVAVIMVIGLTASPVLAAICTTTCGDGTSACPCISGGPPGALYFSKPSCCESNLKTFGQDGIPPESLVDRGRTAPTVTPAAIPFLEKTGFLSDPDSLSSALGSKGDTRASPLFIIKSSFLI